MDTAAQWHLVPNNEIKAAARLGVEVDQGDQHQQRAKQGVEKKFEGCVNFVWPAPDANDQVHRDQGGLEKHVKQHAVQRTKNANHEPAQNQKSAHVLVDASGDHLPTSDHDHQIDESRQQHKPERDAVQTQVIVHIEPGDPGHLLLKLHVRSAQLKALVEWQGEEKAEQGTDQCHPAHHGRLFVTPQGQQHQAKNNWRPDSQAQQTHFFCSPT